MQSKILVVDDAELNRDLLTEILEEHYEILHAGDGLQALEKLNTMQDAIQAVLLDLMMPNMDGFGVLEEMHKTNLIHKIPVLIISGEQSVRAEERCFDLGVTDFIRKPFEPRLIRKRIKNAVDLFMYKKSLEETIEEQTEKLRKQNQLLQMQAMKLQQMNTKIIEVLGDVVEYRNLESGEHIHRVKGFTEILATHLMIDFPEYGLKEEDVIRIVAASPLHDIGKIAIPDSILLKPARLTEDEFAYMKTHTTRGCDILSRIEDIWDDESYRKTCLEICNHHHERYDGRGYPDGLKGEEIPISAQIVSVADVYDALVSKRCYKDAVTKEKAYSMIINGECGAFSPKLMACFTNAREQMEELADRNQPLACIDCPK